MIDTAAEKKLTLSCAESCTGGGVGVALTAVPGSSAVFVGGIIAYCNRIKTALLGVAPAVLQESGAVSEACARQMADGVRQKMGSDIAISITGIAGPGGGSAEKPVGMVCFGLDSPKGCRSVVQQFTGSREAVRSASVRYALEMMLEEVADA